MIRDPRQWAVGDTVKVHAPGTPWSGKIGIITEVHKRRLPSGDSIRYSVEVAGREIYANEGNLRPPPASSARDNGEYKRGYKAAAQTARFQRGARRRLMRPFVTKWAVVKDGVVQKHLIYATEEKANSMAEWLSRPDPGAGYWGRARGPEYDIRAIKVYT